MGRKPIDAQRRQKIIDATLYCISRYGYHETTVAKICAEAGLSTGNIHYYFKGKQNLLEEAMRDVLRRIRQEMDDGLACDAAPQARLIRMLEGNFHPAIFRSEFCILWLHFWSQAPHTAELGRLEKVNRKRFRQNLCRELAKLAPRPEADRIARQIIAMVDGLWIEKAQANTALSPEEGARLTVDFLKTSLRGLSVDI